MSSTIQRTLRAEPARPAPRARDPRRFAGRVKRASLALTVATFGLAWGLVSQHVVGATNAAPAAGSGATSGATSTTPGRAALPATDFFGQPATQPQPILGGGSSGSGGGPVVRGRTS